ncbi:hypothetical protein FOY64_04510 [Mycoplasma capricolum subsp. capripneumoniae]|uniref:hypothetical protein n=1 Tax=Mycoplasma capricolum TaxID=2095 RepID=UPI0002FB2BEF|nr:hypothetical protein [Mycoplasma capricolum]QIN44083.1 hypothetical protein FOY64_04510 [Mycoplasma capricolum subsp. capripneumoniae]WGD33474.1 hypothetical protein Mccp14020TZ_10160 [Mycoplasma capricolum subsp. capripneumoniae]CEA11349.1 hypothetical protein MCCPILRI181_01011 [Mycoplasma capricolum subsp. capripneumoniae]
MNFLLEKTTESVQQIKLELKTTKETWAELVKKNEELKDLIDEFIDITKKWVKPEELSARYKEYIESMTKTNEKIETKNKEVQEINSKLDEHKKELKKTYWNSWKNYI